MSRRASSGGLSPHQALTSLLLGLIIAAVSVLVHSIHGHAPSLPLAVVTTALLALACLPLAARRLTLGRAIAVLAVGESLVHGWLAWFAMPASGSALTTTATLHHGEHITATLAPRDFSVLIPSPAMLVGHLAAAIVLAWVVCRVDALGAGAARLVGFLSLRFPRLTVFVEASHRARSWAPLLVPVSKYVSFDVRRRGPPAAAAV